MQRQRWRWLWIWFGVLVAGCGQVWSSDSSAPPQPTPGLLGYTLLPPSLTPALWPRLTVTPLLAVDTMSAPPIINMNGATTCYQTSVGSLTCLGQFHNPLNTPLEHVVVVVQLLARDGMPLATEQALVARWLIPPGSSGPYRVLFDEVPPGYVGTYTFVQSAQVATDSAQTYTELTIQPVSSTFVLDQYQVSLSMVNRTAEPIDHIAITMSLFDREDQTTGFRRIVFEPARRVAPGESMALTMKVIPQGGDPVRFDAFAEGFVVNN